MTLSRTTKRQLPRMDRIGGHRAPALPHLHVAGRGMHLDTNYRHQHNCAFRCIPEGFPSGQREQTVNLPALPSKVRILPPPPVKYAMKKVG